MVRSIWQGLFCALIMIVAAGSATISFAEEAVTIEEIVVTGSRIQRANVVLPNPVYAIDGDDIAASGELSVVDFLRDVPSLLGSQNGTQANFFGTNASGFDDAPGLSTLDLRNLGTNRTLVLVDGKRHVSGQAGNQAVDIESIPTALIDRVEVLTGGASSIYGADAVSGVVNFILREDFEGTEIDVQYGGNDGFDGQAYRVNLTHGFNFSEGRGNIALYGSYREQQDVLIRERGFSANGGIAGEQNENSELRFQAGDALPMGASIGDLISSTDAAGVCSGAFTGTDPGLVSQACTAAPSRIARNLSFGLTHPGGLLSLNLADDVTAATPQPATAFPFFHSSADLPFLAPGTPVQDFDGNGIDDCTESLIGANAVGGCSIIDPISGQLRAFNPGETDDAFLNFDAVGGDGFRQNGQPDQTLVPKLEQYVLGALFKFDITDTLRVFADVKYVNTTTETQGGGAAFFDTINISPENPFVPAEAQSLLTDILALNPQFADTAQFFLTRDPTDINLDSEFERETFRVVAGVEGEFLDGWDWELAVNYGRTTQDDNSRALLNDRFFAAVDVVTGPDGSPVCRSEVDPNFTVNDFNNDSIFGDGGVNTFTPGDGTCQPLNPFGLGSPSAASQAFVAPLRNIEDEIEQTVISAVVTGNSESWFSLPGGAIGIAGGLEYRIEDSETVPEQFEIDGFFFNSQTAITEGDFEVFEAFVEVSLPLLADIPGIRELTVDGSYRFSDYNLAVDTTNSWGVGASWVPVDDIKFRFTRSRAVRAPNIFELFSPQQQSIFNLDVDPCDQGAIDALAVSDPDTAMNRATNCAQVVGANFNNPLTSNFQGLTGGNPTLQEETADTLTVGVVLQPRFVRNLAVTLDYWDIEIEDAIQELQAVDVLQGCFDGPTLDPTFCDLISRIDDPSSAFFNGLNGLTVGQVNSASLETSGIDFEIRYLIENVGNGQMTLQANGTWLDEFSEFRSTLNPDMADTGVGEIQRPEWSGSLVASYSNDRVDVSWRASYFDQQFHRLVEDTQEETFDNAIADDVWIHDLSGSYRFGAKRNLVARAGINNLTDENPFDTQPSFPAGALGRYYYLGLNYTLGGN